MAPATRHGYPLRPAESAMEPSELTRQRYGAMELPRKIEILPRKPLIAIRGNEGTPLGGIGILPDPVNAEKRAQFTARRENSMNEIRGPAKAIRQYCLWCCNGQYQEVTLCPSHTCALYPFRSGHSPFYRQDKPDGVQTNPVKAIRARCLDCTGGSFQDVAECNELCALNAFRFGRNPFRKSKTDEQRQQAREQMIAMHAARKTTND